MVENDEIIITTIAKICENEDEENTFVYKSELFKKLIIWDEFDKLLGKFKFKS
jgi:hypothetical protein